MSDTCIHKWPKGEPCPHCRVMLLMGEIHRLEAELLARPISVVIAPTEERFMPPALGELEVGSGGYRIEIEDCRGHHYVFQSCVLIENPDSFTHVSKCTDLRGNITYWPRGIQPT